MDIYAQIRALDLAENGVDARAPDDGADRANCVEVDERSAPPPDHRLFPHAHIEDARRPSYDRFERVAALFDPLRAGAIDTSASAAVAAYAETASKTRVMQAARAWLRAHASHAGADDDAGWSKRVREFWFAPPAWGARAEALEKFSAEDLLDQLAGPSLHMPWSEWLGVDADLLKQPASTAAFAQALHMAADPGAMPRFRALLDAGARQLLQARGLRCPFEHVLLGHATARRAVVDGVTMLTLGGYHFWYQLLRDQDTLGPAGFAYRGSLYPAALAHDGMRTPECSTVQFVLTLRSRTDPTVAQPVFKYEGSFLNGWSAEAIMAAAMVRYYGGPPDTNLGCAYMQLAVMPTNGQGPLATMFPIFKARLCP